MAEVNDVVDKQVTSDPMPNECGNANANTRNAGLKIMVNIVSELFKEVKEISSITDKHTFVEKKDKTFITHYPIVFKYMLLDKYCPDAFLYILEYKQELMVANITNDEKTNIDNYCKVQAEYTRQLFKNENFKEKKLQKIYDENYNEVKKMYTESVNMVKGFNDLVINERRNRLISFIQNEILPNYR